MSDINDGATFEGTPAECVCWLETHFSIMEHIAEGAKMEAPEEEKQKWDELIDAMRRSVYKVTVEPLAGMVAKERVRPEYMARVGRIETGLELFDILARGMDKSDENSENNE